MGRIPLALKQMIYRRRILAKEYPSLRCKIFKKIMKKTDVTFSDEKVQRRRLGGTDE